MTPTSKPQSLPVGERAPVLLGIPGVPGQHGPYTWNRWCWSFGSLTAGISQGKEGGDWCWTCGEDGSSGEGSMRDALKALQDELLKIYSAIGTAIHSTTEASK